MKRLSRGLAAALLLSGLFTAPALAAVDPFYLERLDDGLAALERGDAPGAARQLRIAAFGMLDDPVLLAGTLVRLGVAQSANQDRDGFRRTFNRLAEVEERFGALARAAVPDTARSAFEDAALRWIPVLSLRATAAAFPELAARAERSAWQALPHRERRNELERRRAAEPGDARWLLELARLELVERQPRRALDWLDRLPAGTAASVEAECLRQQAASESGQCDRMDLATPFCAGVPESVMVFRLECLAEARRWDEAATVLGQLPPAAEPRSKVARLRRRINEQVAAAPAANAASEPETATPPSAPAEPVVAAPAPAQAPAETPEKIAALTELAALRARLRQASTRESALSILDEAARLADADPRWQEAQVLAGEAAYLTASWDRAVTYFGRTEGLDRDQPGLAFYYAVSLWESGARPAAAELLRKILPVLKRSAVVDDYVRRVLGESGALDGGGAAPGV